MTFGLSANSQQSVAFLRSRVIRAQAMFVCVAILTSSCIPDFVSTLAHSLFQCRFLVNHPLNDSGAEKIAIAAHHGVTVGMNKRRRYSGVSAELKALARASMTTQ
jgi:hypothetical protein